MRIAIVTDIHHGARQNSKHGDLAMPMLEVFSKAVRSDRPDLVLDLGDRITDRDRATDLRLEREVADAMSGITPPRYHINGNHDVDHLEVADNALILGQSLDHEVVDLGAWQLILWRADVKLRPGVGFCLQAHDVNWLAEILADAKRPVLIASHVPLRRQVMDGNYYFQENPEIATYPTVERIEALIDAAPVPVVAIAGHVHWNSILPRGGAWHLTQQSLTETAFTGGEVSGSHGLLTLGEDVHWQVFGADPFEARFRPTRGAWQSPLPRFQGMPPRQALSA